MGKKFAKILLLAAIALCMFVGAAACTKTPPVDGPEVGTYYYDADDGLYYIYLKSGNEFIFTVKDSNETGRYELVDEALTFDFDSEKEDVSATWKDDVLTVTYEGGTMRFLRKIEYTVAFDTAGGSKIEDAVVWNGRTVAKPSADPVRDDYYFIGWYADQACTQPFGFGVTAITANTTVYARWEAAAPLGEYTVSFDTGCEEEMAPQTTRGGKLFDLATPVRSGYTFKGWWISAYEDAEKLTYQYTEDTVFTENTTLFALWLKDGEKAAPALSVTSAGATWNSQTADGTFTIEGPAGFTAVSKTIGATAGVSESIDFASYPAGDYVITFTVNGATATRYYRNKALDRIWDFKVVNGQLLVFNAVEHAEKYFITVECGNPEHVHTELNNGNSTNYNFANCEMQEGGIVFTVYARAEGYADSVAGTYTYDPKLDGVSGFVMDEANDKLTWSSVENAASYIVSVKINDELVVDGLDIGNKTSISLKEYTGTIEVSVYPKTAGFNSPAAATYTYTKTSLATPTDLRIAGNTLKWNAVEGAQYYEVRIDSKTYRADSNSFDFGDSDIIWTVSADYRISVKAVADSSASLWSDDFDARYYAMYQTMSYNRNTVSWRPVIGAVKYEIMINGNTRNTQIVDDGSSSAVVTLTREGYNTIAVKFYDEIGESEWVELDVFAYAITLDSRGGSEVGEIYRAVGDLIELPTDTTRLGYDFDGWYNVPGGASANGAQYTDLYFHGNAGTILYANWSPKTYTVKLENGEFAVEDAATEGSVKYSQSFVLPAPKANTSEKVFIGWYSSLSGGVRYTDANGKSLINWTIPENDIVLYARFINLFEFTKDGDYYQVSGTAGVSQVSDLVIPETYEGIKVVSIADYAFKGCTSLKTVSLPDTIRTIGSEAFDGCTNIVSFEVRETGEAVPYLSSGNGAIIRFNPMTGEYDLEAVPLGASGVYEIPDGVTKIPQNAFKGMANVTEVIIPASVKSVLKSAFVNCPKLTTITFRDPEAGQTADALTLAIDFIDVNVEKGTTTCAAIETINLPARLDEIDQSTYKFYQVYALFTKLVDINVTTGNYYSSIDGVLCNASNGKVGDTILFCPFGKTGTYKVDTQITKIAEGAFAGSSSTKHNGLTELIFHGNMLSIGKRAFYYNYSVTSIVFQASENPLGLSIGDEAFYYCFKVSTLTFEEEGQMASRKVLDEDGNEITQYYFDATKSCGVESIGKDAFYNCREKELVLPSTLRKIDDDAFRNNLSLATLDLSHIHTDLVFGDRVFNLCTGLKSINFTENVGYMPVASVFYKCTNIASIYVDESNNYYSSDADGVLYNKDKSEISYYPDALHIDYQIPASVKKIGGGVFQGKTNISSIVIPKTVEEIGVNAFDSCTTLKSVVFETGAGNPLVIGDSAFYNCTALTSDIILPARTKSVGEKAFYYVSSAVLQLNEGLETIGAYAFYTMRSIESVIIPSTVKEIGDYAFYACSSLSTLTFAATPAGVEAVPLIVGNYVFASDTQLTAVVLPERLQYVSERMFSGDTRLESVTIPVSVGNTFVEDENGYKTFHRAIEDYAFYGCTRLSTIKFTTVSEYEKATGKTLSQDEIKGLSFGAGVFQNNTVLTSLSLPNRLQGVDANGNADSYSVFQRYQYTASGVTYDCTFNTTFSDYSNYYLAGVAFIEVEPGGAYSSYDGVMYLGDLEEVLYCPLKREGEVRISAKAKTIAPSAFRYCKLVTSIVIEDPANANEAVGFYLQDAYPLNATTTSAGTFASYYYSTNPFMGCTGLTSISFPARLTEIGDYAFYNGTTSTYMTSLDTVTFADGCALTSIGTNAFASTKITSIALPAGLTTLGEAPFNACNSLATIVLSASIDKDKFAVLIAGCNGLRSVTIPSDNDYLQEVDGIIYDKAVTTIVYCPAAIEAEVYTIPATVTNISDRAFYNIKGIKKIIFEPSTEPLTFGEKAFYLSGIEEITLPARTKLINDDLFWQCYSLTSVSFEEGFVADLGNYIFQECTSLKNITIPYTVQAIGDYAFQNCTSLLSVTFEDTAEHPSRLYQIGDWTFYGCSAITSVTIPDSVYIFGAVSDKEASSLKDYYFNNTTTGATHGGKNFYNCTSLREVKLSKNIQYLGLQTFYNCSALTSLTLPEGLLGLGYGVFQNCSRLIELDIPDSVTTIAAAVTTVSYLFSGCSSLTSVTLPSVAFIGTYAFQECTSLRSITIPATVKGIGAYAFKNCSNLSTIKFGEEGETPALTSVGNYAFQNSGITSFISPASLTTIGTKIFDGCTKLAAITWNGGNIAANAFQSMASLRTFVFGENATTETIGNYAFDGTSITTIQFPSTVKSLGNYSFQNCTLLQSIKFPASITSLGTYAFRYDTSLTEVIFEEGINLTTIPTYIFYGCTALTAIDIPDTVTSIGNYAFHSCKLLEINIPAAVKSIGIYAFYGNRNATKLTFETNEEGTSALEAICNYAFAYCTSLKEVVLPDSVKQLGGTSATAAPTVTTGYVFSNCTSLETIVFPKNENFKVIPANAFQNCVMLKDFTVPDTVTSIYRYAFNNCAALTSLNLENVTSIGDYAFAGCTNLKHLYLNGIESIGSGAVDDVSIWSIADGSSLKIENGLVYNDTTVIIYNGDAETVTIPEGITTINSYVFQNKKNLKNVILPQSLTTIGDYAFAGCTALKSIAIPDNVTTIGGYAFDGCTALEEVLINQKTSKLDRIYWYAFRNCEALTDITLPDSLTWLGGSPTSAATVSFSYSTASYVFYNCVSLTSINLPDKLVALGSYTFDGCTELTTVTFGSSPVLSAVGSYAFRNCSKLTAFTGEISLTYISMYAFTGCSSLAEIADISHVTYLGSYAFQNCSSLAGDLELMTLTSIGSYAFYNTAITSLKTGATTINNYAFANCIALKTVELTGDVLAYHSDYDYTSYYTDQFSGCIALESVSMPAVTRVSDRMFKGCFSLKTVIAGSVTTVGAQSTIASSFEGCFALTDFDFSTVTGYIYSNSFKGTSLTGAFEIPATGIYYNAFDGCTKITEVSLPNATTIQTEAFANCTSLKKVSAPAFVASSTYVTAYATATTASSSYYAQFRNCTALEEVYLPAAKYIASYMFDGCRNLTLLDLTGNTMLLGVGDYAFNGCSSLTALDFSSAPLYQATYQAYDGIGSYAFRNCTGLQTVKIKSASNIKSTAFENCPAQLTYSSDTSIKAEDGAVYDPTAKIFLSYTGTAANYTIPDGITAIAESAFAGNSYIRTLDLNGVTSIGKEAFRGCTALTTVNGPAVKTLYAYAFADCTALKSVSFSSYNSTTGVTSATYIAQYEGVFSGCTALQDVSMPLATRINPGMFAGCVSLTSFDFSKVNYLYERAFEGSGLQGNLTLSTTTYIYNRVFADCEGITSATFSKVTTIFGKEVLANCINLTEVSLPLFTASTSYNTTYTRQFSGCVNLVKVSMPKVKYIATYMFEGCEKLTSENLELPAATILYVYEGAFKGLKGITSFDFSATTTIGISAFEGSGLTGTLSLPKATTINVRAFADCTGITGELNLASVTYNLYSEAFAGCTGITSLVAPKMYYSTSYAPATATSARNGQFRGCTSLKSVVFSYTTTTNYYVPAYMFEGCTALESFDCAWAYGIEAGAFKGCTSLKTLVIPKATLIRDSAFEDCVSLSEFNFSLVTSFGANAFKGCTGIAKAVLGDSITALDVTTFAGWTAAQTIDASGYKESEIVELFGEDFLEAWNENCAAKIVWAPED